MCFFKLPLAWKLFPQNLHFFLHVFFVCVSSNCRRSEKFSHKSCIFSSCVFCMCFFKLPSAWKIFPRRLHFKIFPQKLQFFLHHMCFFVYVSSNCLWFDKFSHKNCNFIFMWFLYMFLQIAFSLESFPTEFALKNFPTKVAIFFNE